MLWIRKSFRFISENNILEKKSITNDKFIRPTPHGFANECTTNIAELLRYSKFVLVIIFFLTKFIFRLCKYKCTY